MGLGPNEGTVDPRLSVRDRPGPAKCPEPLCLVKALPRPVACPAPHQQALPRCHRSYGLMRQSYSLPSARYHPRLTGLCRSSSAPAGHRTFPALPPRILPQMPGPLPRRSPWCRYSLLPTGHRPSPFPNWVGTPLAPVQRLLYEH